MKRIEINDQQKLIKSSKRTSSSWCLQFMEGGGTWQKVFHLSMCLSCVSYIGSWHEDVHLHTLHPHGWGTYLNARHCLALHSLSRRTVFGDLLGVIYWTSERKNVAWCRLASNTHAYICGAPGGAYMGGARARAAGARPGPCKRCVNYICTYVCSILVYDILS
jgi:hypothetical protein